MSNTSQLPLLIKGYNTDLGGTNNSLPVTAATINWNNVLDSGRGDIVALDGIETGRPQIFIARTSASLTVTVGGVQIFTGQAEDFAPYANPGNYFILPLRQPGGQTLSLNLTGGSGSHGFQVLAFYNNVYATPEINAKLLYSRLKRRYIGFFRTVTTNVKNVLSDQFTIPQGQGNVVGVELVSYLNATGNLTDLGLSTVTVYVNGTTIIENTLSLYGQNACTRPHIFPIFIQAGNTLSFNIDASNCAATPNFTIGLKVYFDDSND